MEFASVGEMLDNLRGVVTLADGRLGLRQAEPLRDTLIDRLVHSAVFGDDDLRTAARWLIWATGQQLGAWAASIDELYAARGRGEWGNATVPAMNLRGMTYDIARAAIRAALRNRVGAFIFEIARSEIAYTEQRPDEYATVLLAAAIREGFAGPIFVQGDHVQINARKYAHDPDAEIEGARKVVAEEVAAGFFNIDVDSSTIVDLSKPAVDEQQKENYQRAAELSAYIRQCQPRGVSISIGGEIGEVGGKNSTEEELHAFMRGYLRQLAERGGPQTRGISKISVQTGTSHGGVVLPDGTVAQVAVDFATLARLSRVAREEYGLGGAVQHGASTLPAEAFYRFPEADCVEVHLATEFQNRVFEHPALPEGFRREVYAWLESNCADERKPDQTERQFVYSTRKKGFGPFKRDWWNLPADARDAMTADLEALFEFYYQKLNVVGSRDLVDRCITRVDVPKPLPRVLAAAKV